MVEGLLKQQFRPEFLNRLDEIVFYKPLTKTEIVKIVDLMLADLQKRLDDKHIRISVSDKAKEYIVECGYDPNFGARPLRRFIQRKVETLAAKRIIGGNLAAGDTIDIDLDENGKQMKTHYYNRPMCYAQYKYFSVMNRNGTTFTVNYEDIILLIIDHKVLVDKSKRKEKR
jgi:ATP-dependent Clp protease ATP-binding subunit ClpA